VGWTSVAGAILNNLVDNKVFAFFDKYFGLVPAINLQQKFQIFRGLNVIIEYFIFTDHTLFIILEYMYMMISST